MNEEDNIAYFLNDCCSSGLPLFTAFSIQNPDVKVINKNYFQCYHEGLYTKYGFQMDDLKTHSFIIYKGEITKEKNK